MPPSTAPESGLAPTDERRRALRAMAAALDPVRPTVLFVAHNAPGGTRRYIKTVAARLAGRVNIVHGAGDTAAFRLCLDPDSPESGVAFALPLEFGVLVASIRMLGVERVDIHHVIGFDDEAGQLLERLGLPFDLHLLDYHLAATHPHLFGADERYVGEQPERWLALARPRPAWIQRADRRIAISRTVASRFRRFWPDLEIIAATRIEEPLPEAVAVIPPAIGAFERLRVLLIDIGVPHKGRQVVADAVRIVAERRIPIDFFLGNRPLTGDLQELPVAYSQRLGGGRESLISTVRPHLAWLPLQAPETYCFGLSDVMTAGLPVATTAVGAIPERVAGRAYTWMLPWTTSGAEWVEMLIRLRAERLTTPPLAPSPPGLVPGTVFYPDEYLAPLFRPAPPQRKIAGGIG